VKRFYNEAAARAGTVGFEVVLDGRPVRTPARASLTLPTLALAEAVAAEWQAQGDEVVPHSMPMMRLVSTALDRVATGRAAVEADLLSFGASDLVCYRADSPVELAQRQAMLWQPVLDWAALEFDAPLVATSGLQHVAQPQDALVALAHRLEALDDLGLMAVHAVTVATGSLLIGLALHAGRLGSDEAWAAGLVDELYGLEVWGDDPETRARLEGLRGEIAAAARLLRLLR